MPSPSPRGSRFVGLCLLLLAGALAPSVRAQGEEPTAPPSAAPTPPAAPAPFVPLEEVGTRAELAKQAIANDLRQARTWGDLRDPREAGETLARDVATQEGSLDERLGRIVSLDRLLQLDDEWSGLTGRLNDTLETLSDRLRKLDGALAKLETAESLWQETINRAQAAPPSVRELAIDVRDRSRRGTRELQNMRSQIVELRTRIGGMTARINGARERIATTRAELLANILVRDQPPLWQMGSSREGLTAVAERVRNEFAAQLEATRQLAIEQKERGSLQLLFVVLLAMFCRSARRRARRWTQEDPRTREVAIVFERPLALALLCGIIATRWIYDAPPRAVQELADLLLLFPALVLIAPLLERSLRPAMLWLAGFYMLDQLRDVVDPLPVVSRTLFTLEMLLAVGAGSLFWWRMQGSQPSVPAFPASHDEAAPDESSDLLQPLRTTLRSWVPTLLQAATSACGFAAVCSILGFQRLARLIGDALLESAYIGVLFYALLQSVQAILVILLRTRYVRPAYTISQHADAIERLLARALRIGAVIGWTLITLALFGIRDPIFSAIGAIFAAEVSIGSVAVSLGDVAMFGVTLAAAIGLARLLEVVLDADIYPRLHVPRGSAFAFSTILRYVILLAGFMTAMSALGFDTNRLTVLLGAFGVGLGFGLQTVVNNFVSGLILLFERPIQVGDAIEVETVSGVVRHIGIRASSVRTWDGSEVSVPNGNLLSQNLTNWTLSDRHRRIEVPVGVAYGSDPERVLDLLREVAGANLQILKEPKPQALFMGFGESSLDFALRAWVLEHDTWVMTRSDLVRGVHRVLLENGIEIPFPQRDLHIRSGLNGSGPKPAIPQAPARPTELGDSEGA